jgi:hypothetical protein
VISEQAAVERPPLLLPGIGPDRAHWFRETLVDARARARRLRKIARDGGDAFAARDQVCRMRHPEVTQAVNETLELLRKAGVAINDVILSKLGVSG